MTYFRECEPAWCPGCGNFPLRKNLIETLDELKVPKELFVMVSGIGQAAKMPHYLELNFFNGLHGRSCQLLLRLKLSIHGSRSLPNRAMGICMAKAAIISFTELGET